LYAAELVRERDLWGLLFIHSCMTSVGHGEEMKVPSY